MKFSLLNAFLFLLLTGLTPLIAQNDVKEQVTVPLTDPGKPGTLEVGLVNGYIHVTSHSGKDVVIEASSENRRNRNDERPTSGGMRRISTGGGLELSAEEKNNRVKVSASSHFRPVNLTIRVPQRFSLKLSTVNEGDITVENVSGELEIDNVNGPIELGNVGGSAVVKTINGDIKVTFRSVNANTPMAFSTLNGNVHVTFPASVKANLKLKSDRGDVYSDFDMDIEKSGPKATRSGESGWYRVSVEDWVYGKINGGGPEVMMKNMNGNIYVRKAQ